MITKTEPMEHQRRAVMAGYSKPYFGYIMDPGTGKTKVVIDETYNLWNEDKLDTVVVVCPNTIMSTWVDEIFTHHPGHPEINLWSPEKNAFIRIQDDIVDGTVSETGPVWWIVSIEALTPVTTKTKDVYGNVTAKIHKTAYNLVYRIVVSGGRVYMAVDESTRIKNSTKKANAVSLKIGLQATYRRIMTGTPMDNPGDIYGQALFLDPSIYRGMSWWAFQRHYMIMGGYENRQILGYRNQEDLLNRLAPHCFRARKSECMDLPERTTQIRWVNMPEKAWRAYRIIVDELAIHLGDSENPMPIDMVIKKITKLRQLTGGWVKPDDVIVDKDGIERKNPDVEPHYIHGAKMADLKEIIEETEGQSVIIWCQFTHEVMAIHEAIPKSLVFHGDMNNEERDEAKRAFNAGESKHIIIQNDCGAMGLTLNKATVTIIYSNPTSSLVKNQLRDRNYRKGQDLPVTEYELLVRGSVDETVYNNIINKTAVSDSIINNINTPENFKEVVLPMKKAGWKAEGKGLADDIGERPF